MQPVKLQGQKKFPKGLDKRREQRYDWYALAVANIFAAMQLATTNQYHVQSGDTL